MATKTITQFTAVTAGNLTGAAVMLVDDSNGNTRKATLATLRTKMFAGGTDYTAADPLTIGALSASSGTFTSNISLVGSRTVSNTSGFIDVISAGTLFLEAAGTVAIVGTTTVAGALTINRGSAAAEIFRATDNANGTVYVKAPSSGVVGFYNGADTQWLTESSGNVTLVADTYLARRGAAMTNGAAAATGTLTNAPAAGNPTKWLAVNDNGTTRYVPAW